MKKLLLLTFLPAFSFKTKAQPSLISEAAVVYKTDEQKMAAGYLHLFTDSIGKNLSISGMVFSEIENNHVSFIGGVGPVFTQPNFSVGAMIGFANNRSMFSFTPWAYAQSNDRKITAFAMFVMTEGRINYMVEALKCVEFPRIKNSEFGVGILNFGTYGGPYFRFSSGKFYCGINPAYNFLPEIKLGSAKRFDNHSDATEYTKYHSVSHLGETEGKFLLHFVIGFEIFDDCNRCSDIHGKH